MPSKLLFLVLLSALLLVSVFKPATARAQEIPPSDLVLCVSTIDDQGNASYALAWGKLLEAVDLYTFRGTDWSFERKIGVDAGVLPLEPGFFPWMVPALGLEGTCGSLESPPIFQCTWEGHEFVFRWMGLTALTRVDFLFGNDFLVPKYIGPEDGFENLGVSSDVYWYAPGYVLEGGCTREIISWVYLPVVESH